MGTMDSGNADGFAMNIELVQKVIAPVTGYLDGMMEIGKGVFRAEQQSAPDDGLHPNNPEAELITSYSFLCICFGHPSIIDSCLNIANLFDMPAHGLKWSPACAFPSTRLLSSPALVMSTLQSRLDR